MWSSILPASISSPYSRSEKPPPLPIRAPVRFTATEPQSTKSISGISSSATTRPWRSAPLIVAASRTCALFSLRGSRRRKGCWSRSRGTAMTSCLPSSRARRRPWVWGESGLALTTCARFQVRCAASFSAASLAPAKLGIRPSAPGNRETPSRSIAFQIARRTWSLERIGGNIFVAAEAARRGCENDRAMADEHRTSLGAPIPGSADEPTGQPDGARTAGAGSRARRDAGMRDLLPAIEPERRSTTGAARSGSRASSTARSWSSSTATGSGSRSRGSRTSRPTAGRCSSPTTPAPCRPTRR